MARDFGKTVLSLIFSSDRFFESAIRIVDKSMFADPVVSNSINALNLYYERYSSRPTKEILVDFIKNRLIGSKKYNISEDAGKDAIDLINDVPLSSRENIENVDFYLDRIKDYKMRVNVARAQDKISKLLSDPGFDVSEASMIMSEAVSEVTAVEEEYIDFTYSDPRDIIERVVRADAEGSMSTGFSYIDEAIGGVALGDLINVYGPSGVGKSTFMQLIGLNLMSEGYNVLYYNLEMNKDKLTRRVAKSLLGKTSAHMVNHQEESVMDLYKKLRYVPVGVISNKYPEDSIKKHVEVVESVVIDKGVAERARDKLLLIANAEPHERQNLAKEFNEYFQYHLLYDWSHGSLWIRKNSEILKEENRRGKKIGHCFIYSPTFDASIADLNYKIKKHNSSGTKIGVVILDYLDLIVDDNGTRATWDNINITTQKYKKMAVMNHFAGVSASQVDSNSRKQMNEGGYLIKGNDSAGWKGRDNHSDSVITLNQTPKMKNNNLLIAYIAKAREGGHAGRAIMLRSDLDIMRMTQESYQDNVDESIFKKLSETDPDDPGNLRDSVDRKLGVYRKSVEDKDIEKDLDGLLSGE